MRRRDQISLVGIAASVAIGAIVAMAGSSGSVDVGSLPVFGACAALAFVINWLVFIPSNAAKTEVFYDLTGSITYVSVTALALTLSDGLDARAWVAALLVGLWAGRLGTFVPELSAGMQRIRQLVYAFYDPEFSFGRDLHQLL